MANEGRISFVWTTHFDVETPGLDEAMEEAEFDVECDIVSEGGGEDVDFHIKDVVVKHKDRLIQGAELRALLHDENDRYRWLEEFAVEFFFHCVSDGPKSGVFKGPGGDHDLIKVIGTAREVNQPRCMVVFVQIGSSAGRGLCTMSVEDWHSSNYRPVLPEPAPGEYRDEDAFYVHPSKWYLDLGPDACPRCLTEPRGIVSPEARTE